MKELLLVAWVRYALGHTMPPVKGFRAGLGVSLSRDDPWQTLASPGKLGWKKGSIWFLYRNLLVGFIQKSQRLVILRRVFLFKY